MPSTATGIRASTASNPDSAQAEYDALVAEWEVCDRVVADSSLDETYTHHRYGEMSLR
jgi:hypothetical protein